MEALNSLYIKTNSFISEFGGFLNYFRGIIDALEFIYGPKVKKFKQSRICTFADLKCIWRLSKNKNKHV